MNMRWMKWLGIAAAGLLVVSCFMDWVVIVSKNIHVSGVEATGTSFGKPGYLHLVLTFFFIVFTLVPRIWAKRFNLLTAGLNLGWALRNFAFIPACSGGECPEKHTGIYLSLIASILMLVSSLFPDITLPAEKSDR